MRNIKKILAVLLMIALIPAPVRAETPLPSDSPEVQDILDKAALARSAGNTAQAIQFYEEAIRIQPDNYILHRNVGVLYYEAKNYMAAGKALAKANRLKPNDPAILLYAGKVLIQLDDAEGAKPYLEQALELSPQNPEIYLALGDMHRRLKEYTESASEYQQALQLAPQDPAVFSGLGHLYYDTRRYDLAAQNFEESLKYSPEDGDTWYNLGMSYFALNDLNKAAECMHRSLTYKPNNAETFNSLGLIFEKAALWDLAERSFSKSLEIDPNYAVARKNLDDLRWRIRDSAPPLFSQMDEGGSPYQSTSQKVGPITVTTISKRSTGFSNTPFNAPSEQIANDGSMIARPQSMISQQRRMYDPYDAASRRRPSFDPITGYDPQTGYADTAPGDATDALVALGAALLGGMFKKNSDDRNG